MLTKNQILELNEYIDKHLNMLKFNDIISEPILYECNYQSKEYTELDNFIKRNRKLAFSQILFDFMDKRDVTETKLYKKAHMDRKHFSKIYSNPDYHPGKRSVISLVLALELDKKETDELLSSAGYTLTAYDTFDLVIQFCLDKRIYKIHDVNMALDYFSLKTLGGDLE